MASAIAFGTLGAATMRGDMVGFVLALIAAIVIGCCQALGELCCLSFLTAFPPNALGGWGAGTGFAGVLGSASFLALNSILGLSVSQVCLLLIPIAPMYLWAYLYLDSRLKRAKGKGDSEDKAPVESGSESEILSLQNFSTVWKCAADIILYLVSSYVLFYLIYPGLIDRATLCPIGKNFISQNAYSLSWITSSIGASVARASVTVFRIERIWILIVLQAVNVFFCVIEATTHTMTKTLGPVYGYGAILMFMVWAGVLAGATYGNCMHGFGKRPEVPESLRELSTTTGFALSNAGIIGSMALIGILDNGMLSMTKLFPEGCPS
jgi:battenin